MSAPIDALIRGINAGALAAGDVSAIQVYFKGLEDAAASVLDISRPGATGAAKIRRLVVDGDLAVPAGNITVGPVATGKGNVIINTDGLRTRLGTVEKIKLATTGDVFIGSDLIGPGTTYFSIFATQQNYNSENFLAGDMLIGDNSTSKANIKWDKANGALVFRGGTSRTITVDTSGMFNLENTIPIYWKDASGNQFKGLIEYNISNAIVIQNSTASAEIDLTIKLTDASFPMMIWSEDGGLANRTQLQLSAGTKGAKLFMADPSALADTVIQTAGSAGGATFATFPGAVNVGTGASTTAGNLTVSGAANITGAIIGSAAVSGTDGTFTGGLNVGTATGAGTGQIAATGGTPVVDFSLLDAVTNAVGITENIEHQSSGVPAAGFGVGVRHILHSSTNTRRTASEVDTSWVVATDASRTARVVFIVSDTVAREAMRLEASGSAAMIGFLGAAAVVKQATITQTYATTSTTLAADTASNMVAGGTGTAAGGWDTAAHRDTSITAFTNLRTDVDNCKNVLNSVIDALQAYGLMG